MIIYLIILVTVVILMQNLLKVYEAMWSSFTFGMIWGNGVKTIKLDEKFAKLRRGKYIFMYI